MNAIVPPGLLSTKADGRFMQRVENQLAFLAKLKFAVPLAWATGFDFLFPFLFIAAFRRRLIKLDKIELFMVVLSYWLAFTAFLSGVAELDRILSSLYSSILIFGFAISRNVARATFEMSSLQQLMGFCWKALRPLFFMTVAFALFGLFLAFGLGVFNFKFQTLLGSILPFDLPGIAGRSMTAEVIRPDWGFGSFAMPRPLIFSPWYTAGAMLVANVGLFTLAAMEYRGERNWKKIFVEFLLAATLFLTLSRTTLIMYGFSYAVVAFLLGDMRRILITVFVGYLGVFGAVLNAFNEESDGGIAQFREYSNESRLEAYELGISLTLDKSVVFGYGVKPRIEDLSIPIGSHSSWISFLVRGGMIAVYIFVTFFYIIPIAGIIRRLPNLRRLGISQRRVAAETLRFQIFTLGWVVLQEVDTAAVAVSLLFITLALATVIQDRLIEGLAPHVKG